MVSVPEPSSTAAVLGLAALAMAGLHKSKKEV
ncbi:MAG: PEP-CTERM sorting domain-containing protein [Roseofilum sp. SBFL]|nr:PEP-CTERM sorting domain-containing protein [Roseofilum sp. SID3]MBP0026191.1 PEP-CTERM sorting domain-containing protein [Roseofilum sp. SID2]MBP0036457.1 PEP-CTERM sorting domain-containing protein [Roseofilum sp. SID1]MBP0044555.1 PEP-CTERM sorting domain-containing protein [Roseofilum sp. SBFL]